jgi:cell division protease FtsH
MAKQGKKDDECWKKGGNDCGPGEKPPMFSPNNKGFKFSIYYFILVIVALMLLNTFFSTRQQEQYSSVEYSTFKEMIRNREIVKVGMATDTYFGYTSKDEDSSGIVYTTRPVNDPSLIALMDETAVEYYSIVTKQPVLLNFLVSWFIPLLFLFVIWRLMFKRMGNMGGNVLSFGKNRAIIVAEGQTGVTFDDVAGADEAKEELAEVVDFLKNPRSIQRSAGRFPRVFCWWARPVRGRPSCAPSPESRMYPSSG